MKSKLITGLLVLTAWIGASVGHFIGYKDGWMAYSTDAWAVDSYHRQVNELANDDDPQALSNIWQKCTADAQRLEREWGALSLWQKWNYPVTPFWKRGAGEPRRISKSQRERLMRSLRTNKHPTEAITDYVKGLQL